MKCGFLATLLVVSVATAAWSDDYQPRNTQKQGEEPPSPVEALSQMSLPDGFEVTLFAHEPAVRQPIAMTLDDRGRLWVVESYSYEEWEDRAEDRILILEDVDGDGRHDKRTVFYDKGEHFAGIALGFGGVWVADAPNVIFIPDKDRNDVPDGPPEIILDGWTVGAEHNMVNGFNWGPDGWLYGRHGVLQWSKVGRPGTPDEEREDVNCGIWRYHPQTKAFEQVVKGTTNPWGLDWDAEGELFMSGNVNGHVWHVIPGAYLERMHPTTRTPYVYERLTMFAEEPHYAGTANWKRDWNRGPIGRDGESSLGGGHSHCGAMIYLGDQWPDDYRGTLFMCNTHGRRVNMDQLNRRGGSFSATYEGDFLKANQSWFRGVTMLYGPDGSVYLSDWTDDGECHDADGVHRTSGRIFKITHGPGKSWQGDLAQMTDGELLERHLHKNAWFSRQSRRLLQERAVADTLETETASTLLDWLGSSSEANARLQALWSLHVIGALTEERLMKATADSNEAVRAWAVRFLLETPPSASTSARFLEMAKAEPSAKVRLYLSSAKQGFTVLKALAERVEYHEDVVMQRMLWFALEPKLAERPDRIRELYQGASLRVARLATRRVMEKDLQSLGGRELAGDLLRSVKEEARIVAMLDGALTSLQKEGTPQVPESWDLLLDALFQSESSLLRKRATDLAVTLRHAATLEGFVAAARDLSLPIQRRLESLKALMQILDDKAIDSLVAWVLHEGPGDLREIVLPSLPQRQVNGWAAWVLDHWKELSESEKRLGTEALSSRLATSKLMAQALADGVVGRTEISASQAQKMAAMKDASLLEILESHWGSIRQTSEDKEQAIEHFQNLVSENRRAPDLAQGKALFTASCAACHQLFGEGAKLAPDLTGSDRGNLDYILKNIIDPSASVAADYRLSIATSKDGRVISGALLERNSSSLVIRTLLSEERMSRDDLANLQTLKTSLMPEGLLQSLTEPQVIDLMGYLRSQVAAP